VTGGKAIAVLLQPFSGMSAINHLVAFYAIHGSKGNDFFCSIPDTTQDIFFPFYEENNCSLIFFIESYALRHKRFDEIFRSFYGIFHMS
jgi:hypothetical protein